VFRTTTRPNRKRGRPRVIKADDLVVWCPQGRQTWAGYREVGRSDDGG
jgi:hypothetical protein